MQNVTGIDIGNVSDILYYQINTDTALHQYVILHKNIFIFSHLFLLIFTFRFLLTFLNKNATIGFIKAGFSTDSFFGIRQKPQHIIMILQGFIDEISSVFVVSQIRF